MRNESAGADAAAAFGADLYQVRAGDAVFRAPSMAWVQSGYPDASRVHRPARQRGVPEGGLGRTEAEPLQIAARAAFQAPPPVTVIVDRPFLFAILDNATGLPVFPGQVSRPRPG